MFEITGDDISLLSDIDLRSLIGLLCEAELRNMGFPSAGVTWGGHQNAPDGGIDVRVELTTALHRDSFIPRSKTGFQVKKPDMPRSSIIDEMRPHGVLRQVIKDLIDSDGAYIIVSSQGSTADSALNARKVAMREAVLEYPNSSDLKVDFYDRDRVAGWVRSHPSLVLWVRNKIGRSLQGWRPYGNWAGSPEGDQEEYWLDGQIRLKNSSNLRLEGLSAIDGINEIRSILVRPRSSVRLVGLSGVGKTRFVQALFDERIGERALNKSQVFYSDISDSPSPDPRNFAEQILAQGRPATIVVDNCPPELHKRLTSICSIAGSLVSLITVEYDVRDDQPEETEVYRLEPASIDIIEKIIFNRFSYVSQVDRRTIAEFSGGNARIAIALANTIRRGENLANLRDQELFNRLFQQRNEPNQSLLRVAEVCSLVYSFNFNTAEDELKLIGSLIGMSVQDVYENVSELKRRELVQQRGIWRAVLPHAVANRLAKRALENIPLVSILDAFENSSPRLLKSFSRRLSYLHECGVAVEVSRMWLAEDGLLGNVSELNDTGIALLKNIAPINPDLTLKAIEQVWNSEDNRRFFSRKNVHYHEITTLLRALAYDKDLFARSTFLLCQFALSESPKENYNSIRKLLQSLFYIYLSGTHATPEQRLYVISMLIDSNFQDQVELGVNLLSAALESWHFVSHHEFEFGAHSRDYGFSPSSKEEVHHWYKLFIDYTISLTVSELSVAPKTKALLAEKFRGLWIKAGMYNELEIAANEIASKSAWREGWLAVKTTKRFDGEGMSQESLSRLNKIDNMLKPKTLIEQAKLFALANNGGVLDVEDALYEQEETEGDIYYRIEKVTRSLGRKVGSSSELYRELFPELLNSNGANIFRFGQGLAEGCNQPEKMWKYFQQQLSLIDEQKRNYQLLRGFLNTISQRERELSAKLLDEAVTDEVLSAVYPELQTSVEINVQDVERLKASLKLGIAPIWRYGSLAYGQSHKSIKDDDFSELLKLISTKPEGVLIAVDILQMRLHGLERETPLSDTIVSLGQELLLIYPFLGKDFRADRRNYEVANIIRVCFTKESAKGAARALCDKITIAFEEFDIFPGEYSEVIMALASVQPLAFLDSFLGKTEINYKINEIFSDRVNPLAEISDDLIIKWCEHAPETRYPKVASAIVPFINGENGKEWTPLALNIITNCYEPIIVLNQFKSTFRPNNWSGSLAEQMQPCLRLISDLKEHHNNCVADWANREERIFAEEIQLAREWHLQWESERNESFE
ncbi:ATP-binding protein [Neobacillus cucumis]|uniref:ATP-binding protein n=1 Tax=Neobacillus cucumis TaxID=1740721 RepID=UPI00203BA955|nr:ATP-binding protein [Neobacillus cucumis]MCM3724591.1 ATP-binding protein [Neobacillus cucumis]